jgi:hypothetical protein
MSRIERNTSMKSHPERSSSASVLSRRKLLASLGALTVAAGVGGRLFVPAGRAQIAGGVFVGKVDGTNAFVGIVTDGQQAEAYVCDGRNFKELFTGMLADANNGRLTLMGEDGDLLPIDFDQNGLQTLLTSGASLTGGLTIGGSSNTFRAAPAMGPGALYLSIGTLPDGSTMDGGTIVLNDGNFRGILDVLGDIAGALGDAFEAAETFEETGETPTAPGDIGANELLAAAGAAIAGDTQGALNYLNGCASGGGGSLCPDAPTAEVNSVPLFSVSMKSGAPGATPTATGRAPSVTATPPSGAPGGGAAPGSTPQIAQQPIAQAVTMMQSGSALTGPNGPQPVPVPVTAGGTTLNAMMVPQTPAKLVQNGPPH